MDEFLRDNLFACLTAYLAAVGGKESTVAQRAAGDWRFFKRLADPSVTFTVRKYVDILTWFESNWPDDIPWPSNVPKSTDDFRLINQAEPEQSR